MCFSVMGRPFFSAVQYGPSPLESVSVGIPSGEESYSSRGAGRLSVVPVHCPAASLLCGTYTNYISVQAVPMGIFDIHLVRPNYVF